MKTTLFAVPGLLLALCSCSTPVQLNDETYPNGTVYFAFMVANCNAFPHEEQSLYVKHLRARIKALGMADQTGKFGVYGGYRSNFIFVAPGSLRKWKQLHGEIEAEYSTVNDLLYDRPVIAWNAWGPPSPAIPGENPGIEDDFFEDFSFTPISEQLIPNTRPYHLGFPEGSAVASEILKKMKRELVRVYGKSEQPDEAFLNGYGHGIYPGSN